MGLGEARQSLRATEAGRGPRETNLQLGYAPQIPELKDMSFRPWGQLRTDLRHPSSSPGLGGMVEGGHSAPTPYCSLFSYPEGLINQDIQERIMESVAF